MIIGGSHPIRVGVYIPTFETFRNRVEEVAAPSFAEAIRMLEKAKPPSYYWLRKRAGAEPPPAEEWYPALYGVGVYGYSRYGEVER